MNNRKTPRIRFKGYTDDWEQRKFSDLVETRRGLTYKPADIREIGVRVLRSSNIDEDCFVRRSDDIFVDVNAINIDFAKENDILITAANGSSRLVGKHTILSDIPDKSTVHGGFMLLGTSEEAYFANALMSSTWYKKFIDLYVSGGNGAIGNLNKRDLDEQDIFIPTKKEQQVIGHYFASFDHLITLHQRKLEKLKIVKKAMLENCFPKNGEKVPKFRFSGFTGDWEQRKLGEIANYRRGSFPQPYGKSEWYDGEGARPFVQVADITDDMNLVKDTKQKISELAQSMSVFAEKNSVLVTLQGSIGRVAIAQYGAFIDRTILIFENYNVEIESSFWAYIIKQKFENEARIAPGGTIKTITKETLSDFDLIIPHYSEQKKLGAFLESLDHLITLHQRK